MSFEYHQNHPHGVMFHRFYGPNLPKYRGALNAEDLESLILQIGASRILEPKEWLFRLANNTLKKYHVCLTFDDCLKSQILVAVPVLKKYNLSAFFFIHSLTFFNEMDLNEVFSNIISTKFNNIMSFMTEFESYLKLDNSIFTEDQYLEFRDSMKKTYSFYSESYLKYIYLRNKYFTNIQFNDHMKKFFTKKNFMNDIDPEMIWMNESDLLSLIDSRNIIGLHSYSHHINFKNLSYDEQLIEYKKNISHLEALSGYKITSASHPLGSYNSDTLNILKDLGIECAFRSSNTIPTSSDIINPNKLELARVDVCDIIKQY